MKLILIITMMMMMTIVKSQAVSVLPLNFKTIDGYNMTNDFLKSKTIIISTFDASSPNVQILKMLDSFQRMYYMSALVIAIPINDFGVPIPLKTLMPFLKDSMKLCFPVMQISQGKAGANQNAIWKWVTDSTRSYFRIKMTTPNQTLMINSSGVPYVYFQENETLAIDKIKQFLPSN